MKSSTTEYLIANFSFKGNNHANEKITKLATGNTKVLAKIIQKIAYGDLLEN